VQSIL